MAAVQNANAKRNYLKSNPHHHVGGLLLPLNLSLYVLCKQHQLNHCCLLLSSSLVANVDGKISTWSLKKNKFQVLLMFFALFVVSSVSEVVGIEMMYI